MFKRCGWTGTVDMALQILRAEYAYLQQARAAALCGGSGVERPVALRVELDRAGMHAGRAYALAQLVLAAPADRRAAIKEGFSGLLDIADAARFRGWVDGSEYWIEGSASMGGDCWSPDGLQVHTERDGVHFKAFSYRAIADERGARELAAAVEREARLAGASTVSVRVRLARKAA